MLETFVKSQGIYYLIAALCVVGIVGKLYESRIYRKLIKAVDNPDKTEHVFLKQLKQKYKNCFKMGRKVRNTDSFIELNLIRYRYHKISLEGLHTFNYRIMLLCIMASCAGVVFGIQYQMSSSVLTYHILAGALSVIVLELLELQFGNASKRKYVLTALKDYLENILTNQLKHAQQDKVERVLTETQAKELEKKTKEVSEQVAAAVEEEKKQEEKVKDRVRTKEQNLAQEKIIAEVIKEFFP